MLHIIISVSRIILVLLLAFYTFSCFAALSSRFSEDTQDDFYFQQTACMYLFLLIADGILFLHSFSSQIIIMTAMELIFFISTDLIYKHIYKNASMALTNNMCILLAISFIILTRLDMDKAYRQLVLAGIGLLITGFIPFLVRKLFFLDRLSYLYAAIGIAGLLIVTVAGNTAYGAKLSLSVGGISLQPSEFVKIFFVFFVASMLYNSGNDPKKIKITSLIAAIHVVILVAARDLGGAGIFLITYLIMLYAATQKLSYLLLGGVVSALGLVAAYYVFGHVRNRVIAWLDPLSVADSAGYQIIHSLFAIGTGGWFGSGLYQGMPEKIPVVEKDFVFSAISEELGGVFALCMIFICISCFLMMFNIAMQIHEPFYKLVALGLGCVYATQTFFTLGGVTRFIPSTGVTLPLVSYGGSSLMSTMILFAIIQGLYVMRETRL